MNSRHVSPARVRASIHGAFVLLATITASGVAAQSLSGPESVEYHARRDRVLVSNTSGGNILARASDGTLSVFTAAPTSPYGIELLGGVLYVLDSGVVKGYDIDTATAVFNLPITGANFLNGITSNGVDTLYVTDFSAKKLIKVDLSVPGSPTQTPLATLTQTPNGIVFDKVANRLLIATWGSSAKVLKYDLGTSGPVEILINTTFGNIDGIALDCNGSIYIAPWTCSGGGCLRRYDPPFTLTSPPQTVGGVLDSPADIDYDARHGRIVVPESGGNRVTLIDTTCPAVLFADDFER